MSDDVCKHEGDRVLLVEGKDDCHVVMSLCESHEIPEAFGIYRCGSDDAVLSRLNALILEPNGPVCIGSVIDADEEGITSRWNSISSKINHYDYRLPGSPEDDGTIVTPPQDSSNLPKLGFWLMPNNEDVGALEDFCIQMADDEALDYAESAAIDAKSEGYAEFSDTHLSKASIHTYLAWQSNPGQPMGQAITAEVLQPRTPIARQFTSWLIDLFT